MNHPKLLWHNTEVGYLDLRSTDHDNHVGPVEHLRQYSTRYLGKRRFIWMAQSHGRHLARRRLLTRIRLEFATSPVQDDSSVWMS